MSSFAVPVVRVRAIEPIPDADAIELAVVGDYRSVVRKGAYAAGDLAAYLPEAAVLPEWLLRNLNLWNDAEGKGRLEGSKGDRIKARRLRGCLSQGILYPLRRDEGGDGFPAHYTVDTDLGPAVVGGFDDAALVADPVGLDIKALLRVTKYEPPIPTHMAGEVCNLFGHVVAYDIENLKAHPDVLVDGEEVAVTEKIHGTFCAIGCIPGLGHPELFLGGEVYVASKGLGGKGLVFKDNEVNERNLYVQAMRANEAAVSALAAEARALGQPIHLCGEVFGEGVQDLTYGVKGKALRAFDAYVGAWGRGRWMDFREKAAFFGRIGVAMVPVLYVGPYSRAKIAELRDGRTVAGGEAHIREGNVTTPTVERRDAGIGRVILKDVSEAYLLRKGGTEFN